jgi:hypothetical protein
MYDEDTHDGQASIPVPRRMKTWKDDYSPDDTLFTLDDYKPLRQPVWYLSTGIAEGSISQEVWNGQDDQLSSTPTEYKAGGAYWENFAPTSIKTHAKIHKKVIRHLRACIGCDRGLKSCVIECYGQAVGKPCPGQSAVTSADENSLDTTGCRTHCLLHQTETSTYEHSERCDHCSDANLCRGPDGKLQFHAMRVRITPLAFEVLHFAPQTTTQADDVLGRLLYITRFQLRKPETIKPPAAVKISLRSCPSCGQISTGGYNKPEQMPQRARSKAFIRQNRHCYASVHTKMV